MKLVLKEGKKCDVFVAIFHHLKGFSDHINIEFSEDFLFVRGMDSSHVSIYDLKLDKNWFDTYELEPEDSKLIGVNVNILYKILNTKQEKQNLQFSFTEYNSNLDIYFISEDKSEFNNQFVMPLMDIDVDSVDIPEKEHQAEIIISTSKFCLIMEQLSIFADSFVIECKEEGVKCITTGIEGKLTIDMDLENMSEYSIEENLELRAGFATKLVQKVCNFKTLSANISLGITKDYPLEIQYNIDETSFMRFMIAPKIDDDE